MSNLPQQQLGMVTNTRLAPAEDVSRNLYEFVMEWIDGSLVLPEHQRDLKWDMGRRRGWIARLQSTTRPVGAILTYQLDNGRPSPVYLNDGSQRIRVCAEYLLEPEKYGDTKENAKALLRSIYVTVQHRHYLEHMDGLIEFQLVNLGYSLSSFDFNKGVLTTMVNYATIWKPLLQQVDIAINKDMPRVVVSGRMRLGNSKVDTLRRDALATFYRFLGQFPVAFGININPKPSSQEVYKRTSFEWSLRELLEQSGPDRVRQEVKRFEGLVAEETSLLEKILYQDLNWSQGSGISLGLYRWLLAAAVWRRVTQVPVPIWAEFLKGVIEAGQGSSSVYVGGKTKAVLSYNRLAELGRASELAGVDLVSHRPPRRSSHKPLKSGWHHSHLQPLLTNGDGPTVPEPGLLNMSRGAESIAPGELTLLAGEQR